MDAVRVALFTDSYTPYVSGVVRSIQTFARGLSERGHQVYIFGPTYREGTSSDPEATRVFRFRSLSVPFYPGFVLPVPVSPQLTRRMRELEIDVIHTHTPFVMGRSAAAASRRLGLPLVFTHHTLYHEYAHYVPIPRQIAQRSVVRLLTEYCNRCDLVLTPTPSTQSLIRREYRLRVPTLSLPTGIELSRYKGTDPAWLRKEYGIPPNRTILLYLGRLGREKNPFFLLDAFTHVHRSRPDALLFLAGDGPVRSELERRITKLGLQGDVRFSGAVPPHRVADYYAGADLFLFPSQTETQGMVTLEAMAAGLPVIAIDAFGTRDLVRDGLDGYLVAPRVPAFAERAIELIDNDEKRAQMGRSASQRASRFGNVHLVEFLEHVYRWLIQTKRRGDGTVRPHESSDGPIDALFPHSPWANSSQ